MNENAKGSVGIPADTALPSNGISGIVAIIQQEFAALDRTVALGGTSLAELTSLGTVLQAVSPYVVPIGAPSGSTSQSAEESGLLALHERRQVEITPTNSARVPPAVHPSVGMNFVVPSKSEAVISSGNAPTPSRPVSSQDVARAPITPMPQWPAPAPNTSNSLMPGVTSAPTTPLMQPLVSHYFAPSASPESDRTPLSLSFPTVHSEQGESGPDSAKATPPANGWAKPEREIASNPLVMNALAPTAVAAPPLSRPVMPVLAHSSAPVDAISSADASPTPVAVKRGMQSDAPSATSQSSPNQEVASEPRQGTIYVDGARLGRWVIDRLVKDASRPVAGTTGIDPRVSATYPGASAGV